MHDYTDGFGAQPERGLSGAEKCMCLRVAMFSMTALYAIIHALQFVYALFMGNTEVELFDYQRVIGPILLTIAVTEVWVSHKTTKIPLSSFRPGNLQTIAFLSGRYVLYLITFGVTVVAMCTPWLQFSATASLVTLAFCAALILGYEGDMSNPSDMAD